MEKTTNKGRFCLSYVGGLIDLKINIFLDNVAYWVLYFRFSPVIWIYLCFATSLVPSGFKESLQNEYLLSHFELCSVYCSGLRYKFNNHKLGEDFTLMYNITN